MLDSAPPAFRKVVDDFLVESREELFPTRQECVAWAERHFNQLVTGELGGNLLSKYSMLGRFFTAGDALEFLRRVLAAAVNPSPDSAAAGQLDTVIDYLNCVALHVPFARTLALTPMWTTSYDVAQWSAENYAKPLSEYAFEEPQSFATMVEPERKALIENRLLTFGEHPSGMGKFTRTLFARDLRRTLVPVLKREQAQAGAA
jgi:hypothetical protein